MTILCHIDCDIISVVIALKINRLLEITIILLNKGTITARELAQRFDVSTRTIYRDVDILSSAGVPVYTNKGNGGGISLLENYSLSKTLMTEQESESLILALKTLQAVKYPEIDTVIDKIGSVFKNINSDSWVHIDFLPWGSKPNEHNKFIDLKKAVIDRKLISFDYVGNNGVRSQRVIEPMRIVFKAQAWYLWGYCRLKEDFRVFRVSRIKNVIVKSEVFKRRQYEQETKKADPSASFKLVHLKLKVKAQVINRLYDDFDEEYFCRNADGDYIVTVDFPEDEWVYGYILSFGHFVEVLEPESIRNIIAERMKQALKYYL